MSDRGYKALALELESKSIMCEVEAMKAENKHRELCGISIAYSEKEFIDCANRLKELSLEVERLI